MATQLLPQPYGGLLAILPSKAGTFPGTYLSTKVCGIRAIQTYVVPNYGSNVELLGC